MFSLTSFFSHQLRVPEVQVLYRKIRNPRKLATPSVFEFIYSQSIDFIVQTNPGKKMKKDSCSWRNINYRY